MCGIAGWIDFERDLGQAEGPLTAMAEAMACRGPDEKGAWRRGHAAFAHRRLIVVDPEGGSQPMVAWVGGHPVVLVYNGELYNTEELRETLAAGGDIFSGHSDTEVLLHAYLTWGVAALDRLNGIFAFAVWDEARQRLVMARDRLGVKPLFYRRTPTGVLLASEVRGLIAHPDVPAEVDREGLAEICGLGPARTPGHGIFRGIAELRPGRCLVVTPERMAEHTYWQLESEEHRDGLDATVGHLRELLADTISRQLVADVPVATLLSGGLDSSVVTALAHREFLRRGLGPVTTFSVEFRDMERHFRPDGFQTNLDGPWVRRMVETLGTRHHRVVLDTPDLVDDLVPALEARNFPGMADVDSSLLTFCREIKRQATVALSGEAADEIFGGYPWFHMEGALRAETFPWSRTLDARRRVFAEDFAGWIRLEEYVADRYQEALHEVPRLPGEPATDARLREIAYLSLSRFMPTLLDRKDRMSMAVGLEVRVPYCDHRLVEYVWNIPWAWKRLRNQPKGILRAAVEDLLPQDVVWRQKSPYPSTANPSYRQAMAMWLSQLLDDPTSPILPYVNRPYLRQLIAGEGTISNIPWFGQLMGTAQLFAFLIQWDAWFRTYRVRVIG